MAVIESGGNVPNKMFVDETFRSWARSVSESRAQEASRAGQGFTINTGPISLTSTSESAILYYKHNEDTDLYVDSIILGIENNGTDNNKTIPCMVIANPSAVSFSTKVDIIQNRDFGKSSIEPLALSLAYKGAEAATVTGGNDWAYFYANEGRTTLPVDLVMRKGTSIALNMTVPVNTSSIEVYAVLFCHLKQA